MVVVLVPMRKWEDEGEGWGVSRPPFANRASKYDRYIGRGVIRAPFASRPSPLTRTILAFASSTVNNGCTWVSQAPFANRASQFTSTILALFKI